MENEKRTGAETAIVPLPEATAELIPEPTARTGRKILCRKHYAESPAGSETF